MRPDWFDTWNNIFSLLQLLYAILHAVVNLLCCCCVVGPSALPFCHVLFLPFFVISPCSLFCLSVVLSFCLFIFLFYFILIHLSLWEVVLVLLESFCACLGDGKQKWILMGLDGMVIIVQCSFKSTFGANRILTDDMLKRVISFPFRWLFSRQKLGLRFGTPYSHFPGCFWYQKK